MTIDTYRNGGSSSLYPNLQPSYLDGQYEKFTDLFTLAHTIKDLTNLVKEIDITTTAIDADLEHYAVLNLKKHQQEISNIELSRAKLSVAIDNSSDLKNLFSSANELGHSLTYKIKSLDHEIGNVDKTLQFVTDVQTLKNNINQANYAIEHKNWTLAAQCINTINNKLDNKLVTGRFASVVIPSTDIPELPQITVEKWINQLTDTFTTCFNEAADAKNIPDITKYFQLFPLINQEEIGLNCYSKFICSIITDTSRTLINSASKIRTGEDAGESSTKTGIFATITMKLFENVSMMLSQHGPLINKYYGETYPDAMKFVVTKIQREIDSQVGLVNDTFFDVRRIDKVIQDTKLHKFHLLNKRAGTLNSEAQESDTEVDDNDFVSIVEVGDLINEFASILHHWSLYCNFITVKYYTPKEEQQSDDIKLPSLIAESNYTKKIYSKYLPAFESLYRFYFRRSIEKAISIEEVPSLEPYLTISNVSKSPDQPPISSVIEDFILVLNSTLRSVIDTAQPTTLKNFFRQCLPVIQNDLINGFLIKSLNDNQPRYNASLSLVSSTNGVLSGTASPGITRSSTPLPDSGAGAASAGIGFFKGASSALGNVVGGAATVAGSITTTASNNIKLTNFVIYLNTVAMGQEYIEKIFDNITKKDAKSLKRNYPFGKDGEKIYYVLETEFLNPITNVMNKIVQDSLLNFYNQSLKNKILNLINEVFPDVHDSNYIIYSSSVLNDTSSILKFTNTWQSLIRPYKQSFHKTLIFDKLLRLLVMNLANLIEKKIMAVLKKFKINELGSMKLEKDLSFIINEVCEDNYELREKFVRVTQLVLLVGMDDDEYELSIQHKSVAESTGDEEENDNNETDLLGMNWVLTPLERKQARKFRI